MGKKHAGRLGWLAVAIVVAGIGAVGFLLFGADEQGGEVLQIDAAAHIRREVLNDEGYGTEIPIYICLAVTSPTRGAVDQLREGNVSVHDPINGPGGVMAGESTTEHDRTQMTGFVNRGGGFYVLEVNAFWRWDPDQYALEIEVVCPWGRGITVVEVPVVLLADDMWHWP